MWSVHNFARLEHWCDGRVVRHVRQDLSGVRTTHCRRQGLRRIELEVHRGHVWTVDALVDLRSVETPRLHCERDMLIPVIVVVEACAFGRRIENTKTNHCVAVLSRWMKLPSELPAGSPGMARGYRTSFIEQAAKVGQAVPITKEALDLELLLRLSRPTARTTGWMPGRAIPAQRLSGRRQVMLQQLGNFLLLCLCHALIRSGGSNRDVVQRERHWPPRRAMG